MTKTHICVAIDVDIYEDARGKRLNISECCEEGLRSALTSGFNPIEDGKLVLACLTEQDREILNRCVRDNNQRALRAWTRTIRKRCGKIITPGLLKRVLEVTA